MRHLVKCGIKDGMTLSFHHHFREGDYVVNMVMEEIHKMGIKDITICASSLGKANDPIVPLHRGRHHYRDPVLRRPRKDRRGHLHRAS